MLIHSDKIVTARKANIEEGFSPLVQTKHNDRKAKKKMDIDAKVGPAPAGQVLSDRDNDLTLDLRLHVISPR